MDFSTLFGAIKSGIATLSDLQSKEVLRERIALLNEQMNILEKAHASTQKELTKAKEKAIELEKKISAYRENEQFIQHKGALFRKDTSGGYVYAVYCPNCKVQVGSGFPQFPFDCESCGWSSVFLGSDLDKVFNSLP